MESGLNALVRRFGLILRWLIYVASIFVAAVILVVIALIAHSDGLVIFSVWLMAVTGSLAGFLLIGLFFASSFVNLAEVIAGEKPKFVKPSPVAHQQKASNSTETKVESSSVDTTKLESRVVLSKVEKLKLTEWLKANPSEFVAEHLTAVQVVEWQRNGSPDLREWIELGLPEFSSWMKSR